MNMLIRLVLVFVSLLGLALPALAQHKADLTRFVVVGDSLSAGYRNFSLLSAYQEQSYAALIAKQAGTTLSLPLIAGPGFPSELMLNPTPGALPLVIPTPGLPGGRVNLMAQAKNLAVPGQTLAQALFQKPAMCSSPPPACIPGLPVVHPADGIQTLTNFVLGLPGLMAGVSLSQVEWVEQFSSNPATRPTFIAAWSGNNDVLFSVLLADPDAVTPPELFGSLYGMMLDRLRGAHGTPMVTANIPDVATIPYLTRASKLALPLALAARTSPGSVYTALGIRASDYLTPTALNMVLAMLKSGQFEALPVLCDPPIAGLAPKIPCVVSSAGVQRISSTVREYNRIIAAEARERGVPVVDVHGLFNRIAERGYQAGHRRLTTELFGGIFSLDAVHPTATGQAILANAFIETLNSRYAAGLPLVDVAEVASTDPLVFPFGGDLLSLLRALLD